MQTMKIGTATVPVLGMGTWHMGEMSPTRTQMEVQSLRYGLDHGLRVIDTAEMYGDGAAERVVGTAIQGYPRDQVYLISKFYPWNGTKAGVRKALTASLNRLGTDYLDLYLLHWRGKVPLAETIATLQELRKEGLIRQYGVSNFDVMDLQEASAVDGGQGVVANEVLYNMAARGIEYDLIPRQQLDKVALIGYSPYGSGAGLSIKLPQPLLELAADKHITGHQLMLAWALRSGQVLSIPKAGTPEHMAENVAAAEVTITATDDALISQYFPAPVAKEPLKVI